MFDKIVNGAKSAVQKIISFIRFIPTVLGQFCMWLVIAALAVVALYLIINILSNAIAGLLGIDDAGLNTTTDYELLSQLTANGYDAVMPADELQEYYAYEYAVLMDLARNLEEAGTYSPYILDTAPYDTALLDLDEWAKLCAESFLTNDAKDKLPSEARSSAEANYGNVKAELKGIIENISSTATETEVKTAIENALKGIDFPSEKQKIAYVEQMCEYIMSQLEGAKPKNKKSKEEVVYKSVTSDTTGETSLVPYLVLFRPANRYTYSFVDKSLSSGTYGKNYKDIFRAGEGQGFTASVHFNDPAGNEGYTWSYIAEYIRPLMANSTLNANNTALYKEKVPGSLEPLDPNAEYGEGVFYATRGEGTVTYDIPIKVLADRFMPKAVLLSSWYMLKQNETTAEGEDKTVDIILDEIRKIYNEACLAGETEPSNNWLLVKDVSTANATTGSVVMKNIFARSDFSSQSVLENYVYKLKNNKVATADDAPTKLLYEKYNTDYDSREYPSQKGTSLPSPVTPADTDTKEPQETLLTTYTQTFGGTLEGDIIDDLDLAIAHHMEKSRNFMNEEQYKKAVEDFSKIIGTNPTLKAYESINEKDDTHTIYQTEEDAQHYVINCEELIKNKEHHEVKNKNGTTHMEKYEHEFGTEECYDYALKEKVHQDPYKTTCIQCFVPQIHVMFARVKTDSRKSTDENGQTIELDVTLKSTALVIIDDGIKYLYRVDGKEIEDLAGLTNNVSFMKFDRYDAQMTNLGDWKEYNYPDESGDEESTYYVITDVFEAWPIEKTIGSSVSFDDGDYSMSFKDENGSVFEYSDEEARNKIKGDIKKALTGLEFNSILSEDTGYSKNEIYAGGLAIIREPDEEGNFTEEALIPPENAAPSENSGVKPSFYTTPGESEIVKDMYINIKGKEETEINDLLNRINNDIESAMESVIGNYCSKHIVWKNDDGKDTRKISCKVNVTADENKKVIIYPVEERVATITQVVKQRQLPMYLPRYANTWSSVKTMRNELETMGTFDPSCPEEKGGFFQLIPRTNAGGGLSGVNVSVEKEWRTKFYAQYFSKVRESDVLAMMAEWENAGAKGVFAAYTYMRDMYSLLQKSKNVKDNNGIAYVHEDSYTYMYIPDEILYFDESVTDKAYWLERLLATQDEDAIKYEENLTMRNKRNVKTWQIVDYEKYEECEKETTKDGKKIYNVYALWPLGGYLGRSLYVFEANGSKEGNKKIEYWGGYTGPGVHSGVDLYGRDHARIIYANAFSNGEAQITAEYKNGEITLKDSAGNTVITGGQELGAETDSAHGDITGLTGKGALANNAHITITLDGTDVTFAGTASAVYGYELYRLTKAYKDGEKAEKVLKETLEKEILDTPVVAIAPGKVVDVDGGFRPGFRVAIEHVAGGSVKSSYVHMKRWPEVQVGEYVGAGTILGYEGTTGNSGGYHTHHQITTNSLSARYPVPYLYPLFTPFYYDEKAKENDYDVASEYMSIIRTAFPYGENVDSETINNKLTYERPDNQKGEMNQVDTADGKIIIKNYVPTMALTTSDQLYTMDDIDEKEDLLKDIEASKETGGSNYNGDDVIALPQYFDKDFIKEVLKNNGHIIKEN